MTKPVNLSAWQDLISRLNPLIDFHVKHANQIKRVHVFPKDWKLIMSAPMLAKRYGIEFDGTSPTFRGFVLVESKVGVYAASRG